MLAIPAFLVVISIVIVFHELGHYWVARLFRTKIDAFSIGFGPKLIGWTDRLGTAWKICVLPLGGYVKFHGDQHAASVPDREKLEELKQQVKSEGVDPYTIIHFKPVWQRALIVFAGPFANFVLALALLTGFFSIVGEPYYDVVVAQVQPATPAERVGIKPGDQILAINGWKVYSFGDLINEVRSSPRKALDFEVKRGDQIFHLKITPEARILPYQDGARTRYARMGLVGIVRADPKNPTVFRHNVLSAAGRGYELMVLDITGTFYYLGDVITGQSAPDQLGGPIRIAKYSGEVASSGFAPFIIFIALISVSVGMINLFPVPILDGGHLLFYAIEAIQGRPLSHRVQEIGFRIGLALIVALFIFVTWNDILYLLPGSQSKPGSP